MIEWHERPRIETNQSQESAEAQKLEFMQRYAENMSRDDLLLALYRAYENCEAQANSNSWLSGKLAEIRRVVHF